MIGPWQASSVVIGMVVGAGIFRTASVAAQHLHTPAELMLTWLLGGVFALAGALCYAELTTAFPDPGGDYRFLREAFGRSLAFLFAWSRFSIIFTASAAMLAFVAADYLAQIVPMGAGGRASFAAGAILVFTLVNLRGLRTSARTQVGLVTLDVVALLALGAVAAWLALEGRPPLAPALPATSRDFGGTLVFVMLAYGGFNDSATLSAEVKGPRDMTRAMIGGMAGVTALYLLANWAYLRVLGMGGLATSDAPAAVLMSIGLGPVGQTAMVAAVGVASLAVLNALMIVGGRTLYAASDDEPALARLAEWDARRGVPRAAVLAQAALSLALVAWGAWKGNGFAAMVDYMAPTYWMFLTLSGLALIRLRRQHPAAERPYRVPLYPVLPLAFSAGSAFVFVASLRYVGWTGCLTSLGVLAFGLAVRYTLRALVRAA